MNQQEVEVWIAANGGAGAVQYGRATTQVDNPAADPIAAKAAGVKFDPTAPEKLTISTEKWTNPKTGAVLHVKRNADGQTFDIVDQANADPSKNSGQTPVEQDAAELLRQKRANAALPKDQDPAYETDEERRNRANATIKQQGADAVAAEGRARQAKIDEQNAANTAADNKRQDDAAAERARQANKPSVTLTDDGKGGKVAVVTTPDGKVSTQPVPGVQGAPPTLTVAGTVYQLQPDGKTYAPAAGIENPNAPIPAGAPTFTPVYGTDDLGLGDYDKALRQAVADKIITVDQGRKLMETAAGLATEAHTHGSTLRSEAATARTQDINQRTQDLGEVQSRRSAANDTLAGLFKQYDTGAGKVMAGDEGLATQAFLSALKLAPANAQAWGGMADVPQVPPSYQQAVGGPSVTVHPSGAVQVQHPAPLLGPPGAPTNIQPAPPTPGEPGGPPLQTTYPTWQPPAAASTVTPAGSDARNMDTQPGQPMMPPQPAFNPAPGEPGHVQGQPVGMAPGNPYASAVGQPPPFTPDVAALRAQGFSDADIAQAHQELVAEGLYAA